MANVRNSRLIFIDSEVNTVGNQSKAKINLPNNPFSVCCEDRMRLTLLSLLRPAQPSDRYIRQFSLARPSVR